jgi:hypothetical protein
MAPVPHRFNLCTLNIQSLLNTSYTIALNELVNTHQPDLVAITETWIKPLPFTTESQLIDTSLNDHTLLSSPCPFITAFKL